MIFKTKKKQNRWDSNCPNGVPKWIRCYDNGGKTVDRYTVVYTKKSFKTHNVRYFMYVCMSAYPFHPQGIGMSGESNWQPVDRPTYGHLGKKINFQDLPEDCQKLVLQDYKYYWDFINDDGQIVN